MVVRDVTYLFSYNGVSVRSDDYVAKWHPISERLAGHKLSIILIWYQVKEMTVSRSGVYIAPMRYNSQGGNIVVTP